MFYFWSELKGLYTRVMSSDPPWKDVNARYKIFYIWNPDLIQNVEDNLVFFWSVFNADNFSSLFHKQETIKTFAEKSQNKNMEF